LIESEDRWEVIVIESDEETKEKILPKKRKEAPEMVDGVIDTDAEVDAIDNDIDSVEGAVHPNGDDHIGYIISDANNSPYTIVVDGCGDSRVRGLYKKSGTLANGSPSYRRKGIWRGSTKVFALYYQDKYWFIGICSEGREGGISTTLYRTMDSTTGSLPSKDGWIAVGLPPKDGWIAVGQGVSPAPKLIW